MNTKMNKLALASAIVLGGSGLAVNAYAAPTTDGTATATVVTPISITAVDTLRFGSFSTATAGDTVTISTAGARTPTGTALLVTSTFGAASFTVSGDAALTYAITLPSTAQSIAIDAGTGASAMAVTAFASDPSGNVGALTTGPQTLLVGATVNTVAGQVAGAYTGTFPVTVAYN